MRNYYAVIRKSDGKQAYLPPSKKDPIQWLTVIGSGPVNSHNLTAHQKDLVIEHVTAEAVIVHRHRYHSRPGPQRFFD
jgi:hypothetical protein